MATAGMSVPFGHIDREFKDFLLPRVLYTRETDAPEAQPTDDYVWQEFVTVALKPHPGLNENQQQVVARDYGMKNGVAYIEVRLALLYYFLKRLGLDFSEARRKPREQHGCPR